MAPGKGGNRAGSSREGHGAHAVHAQRTPFPPAPICAGLCPCPCPCPCPCVRYDNDPNTTYCPGNSSILVSPGFWRASVHSFNDSDILQCLDKAVSCPGGYEPWNGCTNDSYVPNGTLCEKCEAGFTPDLSGYCAECPPPNQNWALTSLLLFAFFLLIFGLAFNSLTSAKTKETLSPTLKITLNYMQVRSHGSMVFPRIAKVATLGKGVGPEGTLAKCFSRRTLFDKLGARPIRLRQLGFRQIGAQISLSQNDPHHRPHKSPRFGFRGPGRMTISQEPVGRPCR